MDKPVLSNGGADLQGAEPCAAVCTKHARRHTTTLRVRLLLWITMRLCQNCAQSCPQRARWLAGGEAYQGVQLLWFAPCQEPMQKSPAPLSGVPDLKSQRCQTACQAPVRWGGYIWAGAGAGAACPMGPPRMPLPCIPPPWVPCCARAPSPWRPPLPCMAG